MQLEIPTISALIAPYQHYPKAIQQAIVLADAHPSITHTLTKSFRAVLRALVTRCNRKDGCAPLMARVDHLADEAGVCEKTVQRAIAFLKRIGWLEQVGDGRDDGGSFTFRSYRLLPALVALLRLPFTCQKTKMSDGLYIDLSIKEDHPGISAKAEETPKPKTPIQLPQALEQAAQEFDVTPAGMCKLRGIAHKAGYQLEQVIAAVRAKVKAAGASGGRFYRYLTRTIERGGDFAGRAAQEARIEAETAEKDATKARAAKHAGKRYKSTKGTIIEIDATGWVATVFKIDGKIENYGGLEGITSIWSAVEGANYTQLG